MRVRRGRVLALLWVLVAAASGCDVPLAPLALGPSLAPNLTSAPSVQPSTSASPLATPQPTPTPQATPSASPSPTPTVEPTPEVTPTPVPTPTPPGTILVGTSPEASGAWTAVTAMARPRMGHVVVPLDGRLVVSGGFPDEVLEGYRPSSDSWLEQDLTSAFYPLRPNGYPGQYFSCGGTVGTNRFVVAGGFDGSGPILYPRVYTLTEGFQYSVAFGNRMAEPRYAVAGATIGSKLYVAGGLRQVTVNQNGVFHGVETSGSLDAFDLTKGSWTALASMSVPVSGATAVAFNGQLCVLGGRHANGETTNEVQVYSPDSNQWVSDPGSGALPAMRVARHSAAAAVFGGRIYVFGGMTADGTVTNSAEVYDPTHRIWQMLPAMPFARCLHAAVALDNRIYVLGGNNPQGQPQRSVEAFVP
ncbi:MAG TPA: kelch repeat-containing protein [Stenomitos sp.]